MPTSSLHRITNPEQLFQQIKSLWKKFHEHDSRQNKTVRVINTTLLERLATDKHTLFIIFDAYNFDLIYVGKNAEEFVGFTAEDILAEGFELIFKMIPREHLQFFVKILEWARVIRDQIPFEAKQAFMSYVVSGISCQHKSGKMLKLMCRIYAIELTPSGFVDVAMIEIMDITNLIKSEEYWMRVSAGACQQYVLTFFSNKKSDPKNDLVTEREREVLELLSEGKTSKEIAEILFISTSTVEKHKKNMLARLGARDSVALTEICKRCGII